MMAEGFYSVYGHDRHAVIVPLPQPDVAVDVDLRQRETMLLSQRLQLRPCLLAQMTITPRV